MWKSGQGNLSTFWGYYGKIIPGICPTCFRQIDSGNEIGHYLLIYTAVLLISGVLGAALCGGSFDGVILTRQNCAEDALSNKH